MGAVSTIAGIGVVFQIAGLLFAINVLAQTDVFGIPELSVYSIFLLLIAVLLLSLIIVAFELALAMGAKSAKRGRYHFGTYADIHHYTSFTDKCH